MVKLNTQISASKTKLFEDIYRNIFFKFKPYQIMFDIKVMWFFVFKYVFRVQNFFNSHTYVLAVQYVWNFKSVEEIK